MQFCTRRWTYVEGAGGGGCRTGCIHSYVTLLWSILQTTIICGQDAGRCLQNFHPFQIDDINGFYSTHIKSRRHVNAGLVIYTVRYRLLRSHRAGLENSSSLNSVFLVCFFEFYFAEKVANLFITLGRPRMNSSLADDIVNSNH